MIWMLLKFNYKTSKNLLAGLNYPITTYESVYVQLMAAGQSGGHGPLAVNPVGRGSGIVPAPVPNLRRVMEDNIA